MKIYAIAKFIEVVGGVDARKRLQKSIFFIQEAGLDLGATYFLHYYGPYSRDVAEATDMLTKSGILEETPHPQAFGEQYSYKLTAVHGMQVLSDFESTDIGREEKDRISAYFERFQKLAELPLWDLELAATIAFYHSHEGLTWPEALAKTAEFKQVAPAAEVLKTAEQIARNYSQSSTIRKDSHGAENNP